MAIRYQWIDWAKFICISLMVCGHANCNIHFHDFLYLFHLPVFFIISGFLFKEKSIYTLFKILIIPTIIWNLINYPWYMYSLIHNNLSISINSSIIKPFLGFVFHDFNIGIPLCGVFWFVITIFILRILLQLLYKKKYINMFFLTICFICSFYWNSHPEYTYLFIIQRAIISYPFFYLGYFLKKHVYYYKHIDKNKFYYCIISLCILIAFVISHGTFDLYSCQLGIFPLYYIIGVIGFIFIYTLSSIIAEKYNTPIIIKNISNGTLVILGLHAIILFSLNKLCSYQEFILKGEIFSLITITLIYPIMTFILKKYPTLIGKS